MNKQPSIKKNFVMNVILTMSSFLFPLITFPYVSRVLGPEGTGKVSFATSLLNYFCMIAQLGIPTYGIRVCARVRNRLEDLTRTVQELFLLNAAICIVSYLLFFWSIGTIPQLQEDKTLYLAMSVTIFFQTIGMEWLYKAMEQYTYITLRSILFKFVALVAMFLLVRSSQDYVIYGILSVFASCASNILNFINIHRHISLKPVMGYQFTRHLKPILVFFAMSCATTVYTNMDAVMLGFMSSDAQVGYYNAAIRIKSILVSIVTSLGAVLLPRASYYIEQGKWHAFWNIAQKAMHFVLLAAAPMMLYFLYFARNGVLLLSGEEYAPAIFPMQILMPTVLLIAVTNILGIQILVPLGKERFVLCSEIAGAITDFVLNAVLIPRYAAVGAALGTLAAEIVVLLVQLAVLRQNLGSIFRGTEWGKLCGALLLSSVAVAWIPLLHWGHFLSLAVSAVLFFGIYGGVLLLTRETLVLEVFSTVKGLAHKWH